MLDDAVHPVAGSVYVTVYTPDALAVMLCVVAPVFHRLFAGCELVNITDSPGQKVVGPFGVINTLGGVKTLTTNGADVAEHPVTLSVTVTVYEYVPLVKKNGLIDWLMRGGNGGTPVQR